MVKENLGSSMLLYRAKERISQAELARRCGLSIQTVYSIEKGHQTPSKQTTIKILMVIAPEEVEHVLA